MSREFAIEGPVGTQLKQNLVPELHRRYECGDDALDIAEYIAVLCASNKPSSEIAAEVRDTCGIPIDEDFVNVVFNEIERLVFEHNNPQPQRPEIEHEAVIQNTNEIDTQNALNQSQSMAQPQSQIQPQALSEPLQPTFSPLGIQSQAQPQSQFPTTPDIFTPNGQPFQPLSNPRVLVKPPPTGPKMLDRRSTHAGVSKRAVGKPRDRSQFGAPHPSQVERALNQTNPAITNVRQRKTRCKLFPDCPDRDCESGHPMRNCNNWPNCPNSPGTCNYLHPDEDAELIERWEAKKKSNIEKKRNFFMVQQGTCKFKKDCTKDTCPFAHPTPANPLALISTLDWCPLGKNCIDPLCVKAHPPPPTAKPVSASTPSGNVALEQCKFGAQCTNYKCPRRHASLLVACRLGADCLRVDCFFSHPIAEPCRFAEKCLNKFCMYTHPPGREVLENTWSSNGASTGNIPNATNQRAFAVPDDQVMEQAVQQ